MHEYVGVWIDRSKAVVVTLLGEEQTVTTLKSNIRSDPDGNPEPVEEMKNDPVRKVDSPVPRYYRNIIDAIEDPHEILIIGPDNIKTGLEKMIKTDKKFSAVSMTLRTAGPMSTDQISEYIRGFFRYHDNAG